ncbi:Slp family lipoprotein [Glaciecola sp. MH2013]|uniref:Slp family lipoprotein n=1 Tax=Glaciecola sp. MH2013 TaxID=2785524 RepID=UPI001E58782D|nr:Slp family lipoprotein [Glaciecola sp. MH2013]
MKIPLVAAAVFLAGCAVYPDQIDVADDVNLVSYEQILNGESAGTGSMARWGGEIVAVENKADYSEIEILHYQNNHYGKPRATAQSAGRFKVRVRDFIDPLVFSKGRLVTFIGEIGEPAEGVIGEQTYVYPVLLADGYHMWKKTQDYDIAAFHFSPFSPFWAFGPRFGYHRGWRFYDQGGTVRVKVKDSVSGQSNRAGRSSPSTRSPQDGGATSGPKKKP